MSFLDPIDDDLAWLDNVIEPVSRNRPFIHPPATNNMLRHLRNTWDKNWPEIRCAATGSVPDFILSRTPKPLADSVPVFCYHVVSGPDLEQDLRHLRENGYATLSSDALLAYLNREFFPETPSVVLSFDDCSRNLFQVAYPLLKKYDCQAVAFAAPAFHDLAEGVRDNEHRPCTWDELAALSDSGIVDIQSHSLEHRLFSRWPEPVPLCGADFDMNTIIAQKPPHSLEEDLLLARETLEQKLGTSVRHLAFPKYYGTDEAIRIGRKVGYSSFWWGVLPGRPTNHPGDSPDRIVRISGEFLRRLPGERRIPLMNILMARYGRSLRRWVGQA